MTEARVRVFVVEDQPPLMRNVLKALSLYPELEVVGTAVDGETGADDVIKIVPNVVLLDLELPGIDGIEVTKRIKAKQPGVEVLILTSFDHEQKVYEAMQAGASGYLVKRVGPEKIRAGIHDVMNGGFVVESLIAKRFWNYFHSVQAKPAQPANPWNLSEIEFEVLRFVAKGLTNVEVGKVLSIERRTVRTHLGHIYRKMGVATHVDAVVAALKAGIVEL